MPGVERLRAQGRENANSHQLPLLSVSLPVYCLLLLYIYVDSCTTLLSPGLFSELFSIHVEC